MLRFFDLGAVGSSNCNVCCLFLLRFLCKWFDSQNCIEPVAGNSSFGVQWNIIITFITRLYNGIKTGAEEFA
jgi:hypothetical protein